MPSTSTHPNCMESPTFPQAQRSVRISEARVPCERGGSGTWHAPRRRARLENSKKTPLRRQRPSSDGSRTAGSRRCRQRWPRRRRKVGKATPWHSFLQFSCHHSPELEPCCQMSIVRGDASVDVDRLLPPLHATFPKADQCNRPLLAARSHSKPPCHGLLSSTLPTLIAPE